MNKSADQGWNQIQARIDQMLGKYTGQELHKIDRPTQDIDNMLQRSPDYKKNNQSHNDNRTKKLSD